MIAREHIPNILTMLRVVLAAGFFGALSFYRFPDTGAFWGNIVGGKFGQLERSRALGGQAGCTGAKVTGAATAIEDGEGGGHTGIAPARR